jgi:hypothetical protein
MGIYRVEGIDSSLSGSSYTSGTGSLPASFGQALQTAQTATNKAISTNNPQDWAAANQDWSIVGDIIEYNYQVAQASPDSKNAIAALDAQYKAAFRGHGKETQLFDKIVATAKDSIKGESQADAQFQVDLHAAQQKVTDAFNAMQSAKGDDAQSTAMTNYTAALTDLVNLELRHQLGPDAPTVDQMKSTLGPGPHTLDEWMAAAKKVEQQNHITGDSAQIIDTIAKVNGYVDEIQNNPGALKLTPAQLAEAKKDPVTYAFLLASGAPVNPNDPALANLQQMQTILSKNPVLYTLLWQSGVKIWTDKNPVTDSNPNVGLLNGQGYLHVTINGKPVDEEQLAKLVAVFSQNHDDNRALAVGAALLPSLHLADNSGLQSLMIASDSARTQYGMAQWSALTSGSNVDGKAAISFLNTQLNGFFDPNKRKDFWNNTGKSYFTVAYFRHQFDLLMQKPNIHDENYYRDSQNSEIYGDKVGDYMQSILKDAPPEIADVMLDAVKSGFSNKWYQSNNYGGGGPRFVQLYKALSMAVELDPSRAKEFADWLTDRKGPQAGILPEFWDPQMANFEGLSNTIAEGYGATLSTELKKAIDSKQDFENMRYWFDIRYGQGTDKVRQAIADKINNQDYADFMKDPDKTLKPFFQSFLNGGKVGEPLVYQDDTQWHDIIGETLGLTPNAPGGQQAADAHNYNVEWYKPGTAEWNTIMLVGDWLHDQGADKPGTKVTAVPFKYVSQTFGVQTGGMFLIDKPGTSDDDPAKQEVIDGMAALNAVSMNGGNKVDGDVNVQWHFGNYNILQTDANYDNDGYFYMPTNFRLLGHNGQILSSDYTRYDAHIKTFGEYAREWSMPILAGVGFVCLFIPGAGWAVDAALIAGCVAGVASSTYELIKMNSNGESISWSNPEARGQWLNLGGNALALARLGFLFKIAGKTGAWANTRKIVGSLMGTGATAIGMYQTAGAAAAVLQTVEDPHASLSDKVLSFTAVLPGLAMIAAAGMKGKPGSSVSKYDSPGVGSPRQTGTQAFVEWDNANGPAGGPIATLWEQAKTKLQNRTGRPAYDAWKAAGHPQETWWDQAVADVKNDPQWATQFQREAQNSAGQGNSISRGNEHAAVEALGLEELVGQKAYEKWTQDTNPKTGVTTKLWSKAQKQFNTDISWKAYQRWRAEQGLAKHAGLPAYKAYKDLIAAGNPAPKWWTDAIAKLQGKIDTKAEKLWNTDTDPSKPGDWHDPKYMAPAQDAFGAQIGVEAYKNWNAARSPQAAVTALFRGGAGRAYKAYTKYVPGKTAPAWWTQAIAKFQTRIDTEAQALWQKDKTSGKPAASDPKYVNPAQDKFGPQIALEALRIWKDPAANNGAGAFLPGWKLSQRKAPSTFTYKAWVKAGLPERLTTKSGDDVSLRSLPKKRFRFNQVTQAPTDVTIWKGAERVFKVRIGKNNFTAWKRAGQPLGTEDTYFEKADQHYKNEIGSKAYKYFDNPSSLPGNSSRGKNLLGRLLKKGVTAQFWKTAGQDLATAKADFDNRLQAVGADWMKAPLREGLPYWKEALADLDPEIKAKENELRKQPKPPASSSITDQAHKALIDRITLKAYEKWLAARSSSNPKASQYDTEWQAATKVKTDAQKVFDHATGAGGYDVWSDAGKPDGWYNQEWVLARREVRWPDARGEQVQQFGENTRQRFKDLRQQTWSRLRARGGAGNLTGWKQHFRQMGQASRGYLISYAAFNAVGTIGWAIANYGSHEVRKPGNPITNPQDELTELLQNPEKYMNDHYDVQILGQNIDPEKWPLIGSTVGPAFHEASGDLMVFTDTGGTKFFRRIPKDLYDALMKQAKKPGDEPWILGPQTNQVINDNGKLYFYQPIKLSDTKPFTFSNADPLKTPADKVPLAVEQQIGVRAYMDWLKAGLPQSSAGPANWSQAQQLLDTTGKAAYNDWVNGGRQTWGANSYWGEALAFFQPQIDGAAKKLAGGGSPTEDQKKQAEQQFGAQIALRAYQYWDMDGAKDQSMAGVKTWNAAIPANSSVWTLLQQDLLNRTGTAAYNDWVSGGRPTTKDDSYWGQALAVFQPKIERDAKAANGGQNPTKAELNQAEKAYGPEIAMLAFQFWVMDGGSKPKTTGVAKWNEGLPPGASAWIQAQQVFKNQPGTGTLAYTAWVQGGRQTNGANSYWGQALALYQPQIDDAAKNLAGGGTPTQAQKNQAEQQFGPEIAMLAFQYWVSDGGQNQNTAGVTAWNGALPKFQLAIGKPAFDAWARANRSVQDNNTFWGDAVAQWKQAGMPILQKVELWQPWRYEPWNTESVIYSKAGDGASVRRRWTWGVGPIEGWRLHANMETTFNYRYNTATATTLRIGGPSPTQGWGIDVRQQDTTFWSRFVLGGGTWEVNGEATGTQAYDLTRHSVTGYTIMNGRIYLDTGNRNRTQIDGGKFLRLRETAFAELGLGIDFLKWNDTNGRQYNFNGYYELQWYPADFRAQFNSSSFGSVTNTRGFTDQPPPLGIDPALQFTVSDSDWRLPALPFFSGEKR